MNIHDLYAQLEDKRKLIVSCHSDQEYYALRASIYRARRKQLEAFAMIDETDDEDGFQLIVRRNKESSYVTLELAVKEPKRQWVILEEGTVLHTTGGEDRG